PATLVFLAAVGAANYQMAEPRVFSENRAIPKREAFRAVVDTTAGVRACDPSGDVRFWYDAAEPAGLLFRASASTQLWMYRLIGEAFPSLTTPASSAPSNLDAGDRALIMSGQRDRWRLASEAARPHALQVDRLWSRPESAGPVGYEMTCVRLAPFRAEGESPTAVPVDQFTRSV